jgi:hypothetical protein
MRLIGFAVLAMLAAGPGLAEEAPKRIIDRWTGIVLYCSPDLDLPWTEDACAGIADGVVRQAGDVGMNVALLEMTGEPQWMAKSAAAGFDGGNALSMLFAFKGSERPDGNTALDLTIQAPVNPKPGVNPTQWALLFTQTTTIDPGEHTEVAVDAAATVFGGILEYLQKPPQ